jgi:hypothetical protein
MQKGLIILFMFCLIGILILSELSHEFATGRIVNEFGELRDQRIELYMNFPNYVQNYALQSVVDNVRRLLLFNAQGAYYMPFGIYDPVVFFNNERELIDNLLILACEKQPSFINYQVPYPNTGVLPCDEQLRSAALDVIGKVIDVDIRLVEATAVKSKCPGEALDGVDIAKMSLINKDYNHVLLSLQASYTQSLACA